MRACKACGVEKPVELFVEAQRSGIRPIHAQRTNNCHCSECSRNRTLDSHAALFRAEASKLEGK